MARYKIQIAEAIVDAPDARQAAVKACAVLATFGCHIFVVQDATGHIGEISLSLAEVNTAMEKAAALRNVLKI